MQPETLGRYKIVKELGRGAMGRVFLAHDPQIDRQIAIKTVQIFSALPESERAAAREAVLREARAAGKLIHPGIVTLFDVGEAGGLLYLAMEYVQGPTLDTYVQRDRLLPIAHVVDMVSGVAEALEYAHHTGIVHRDIKPANLIHVGGTKVKIMDFGLAKPAEAQLTHDGALLGTPSYMSPEQIRSQQVDGRSDLFSLAVVLFELLTGERPFPGDSVSSIIYRIVNEEARDPRSMHDRVTPELAAFVRRNLSKDPNQRLATGAQFASELRRAGGRAAAGHAARPAGDAHVSKPGSSVSASGAPGVPPAHASRPRRSSIRPFLLAAVLLVTVLAAVAYQFRDRLGLFTVEEVWWEARVRVEPPGVEVLLDGAPLDPRQDGLVRFRPEGPFGTLTAQFGCRSVERQLSPEDAGGEIVLVLDPIDLAWPVDPSWESASIRLNGDRVDAGQLDLDLCRDNQVELEAEGFFPATLEIPAAATPLEARTLLAEVQLAQIPIGRLVLPKTGVKVVYYVDGDRLTSEQQEIELTEGEHEVRIKNEHYWIDVRRKVQVVAGETVEARLDSPALTDLVVQAYPSNCKVYLRRPGGKWKYLDDTPARRRVAVGRYEVRVKLNPTGETREQQIELVAGDNPPVRVAFGRRS
jgi:hypothetical protein